MKIRRVIDGKRREITLTQKELDAAFAEGQENRDIEKCREILDRAIKKVTRPDMHVNIDDIYFTVEECEALIRDTKTLREISRIRRKNEKLDKAIVVETNPVFVTLIRAALTKTGPFWTKNCR